MKSITYIYLLIMLLTAQMAKACDHSNYNKLHKKISCIEEVPMLDTTKGDSLYWHILGAKEDIRLDLIQLISDTTLTKAKKPLVGKYYRVGDIAISLLTDYIKGFDVYNFIPDEQNENFETIGEFIYWFYVENYSNRIKLQEGIKSWYNKNLSSITWKNELRTIKDNKLTNINKVRWKINLKGYYYIE